MLRVVEKSNLLHQEKDDYGEMLGFEAVCLVPFEPKLIKYEMLSDEQIDWMNRYNAEVRNKVGPVLREQDKLRAYEWMMQRTVPLTSEDVEAFR